MFVTVCIAQKNTAGVPEEVEVAVVLEQPNYSICMQSAVVSGIVFVVSRTAELQNMCAVHYA